MIARLSAKQLLMACGALLSAFALAQSNELELNRARWQAAALAGYKYGYNKYCDCHRDTPPETFVTVRAGAVVAVHHRHTDSPREVPAREGSLEYYWTIDELFSLLESGLAREAVVKVRYDEQLGYPSEIYIDYDASLVGDELDVRLTSLQVLAP